MALGVPAPRWMRPLCLGAAAGALCALRALHLLDALPVAALLTVFAVGIVASEAAQRLWEHAGSDPRWRWAVLGVQVLAVSGVIYATGWGPALAVGYLVPMAATAPPWSGLERRVLLGTVVAGLAGGELAVALGALHHYVPAPSVHALAVLAALGIAAAVRLRNRSPARADAAPEDPDTRGADARLAESATNADPEAARAQRHLAALIDASGDAIIGVDLRGCVEFFNPAASAVFGYEPGDILGRHLSVLLVHEDPSGVADTEVAGGGGRPRTVSAHLAAWAADSPGAARSTLHLETRGVRRDGTILDVALTLSAVRDEEDAVVGGSLIARDVTSQKEAAAALARSEASFRLLFAANPHPMWVYDAETLAFLEVNEAAIAHYGFTRDQFLAMRITDIPPVEDIPTLLENLRQRQSAFEGPGTWRHVRADRSVCEVEVTSHALIFSGRRCVLALAKDVTDRNALERQLLHRALHDELTGLANRTLLSRRIDEALARSAHRAGAARTPAADTGDRAHPPLPVHESLPGSDDPSTQTVDPAAADKTAVALLVVDVDHFGQFNEAFGPEIGDRLLQRVAEVLLATVRPSDTVARMGSDEFAIVIGDLSDPIAITEQVSQRVLRNLSEPITLEGLDGHRVGIEASIGIALGPDDTYSATPLVVRAEAALARAKRSLLRREVVDLRAEHSAVARLAVVAELRQAIDEGQLHLHYQPKIRLSDGQVVGAEALVRWEHPERGTIPPDEFVPLAERTGLIRPLTSFVLCEGLRQLATWREAGGVWTSFELAVNLGAANLTDTELPGEIDQLLRRHGIPPEALTLEITETAVSTDPGRSAEIVTELSRLGVELSVDDFGTGYSSLSRLRALPLSEVKLDRSFVSTMLARREDATIVRSSIELAHDLGLRVVGEGIETQPVVEELRALGCDFGQGYWLCRPIPPQQLSERATRGQPWYIRHNLALEGEVDDTTTPAQRAAT